jgi:hypothetical protein
MNHLSLTKGEIWAPAAAGKLTLRGVSGRGWATVTGDSRDYVLDKGHRHSFEGPGLVVQATEDLEFCFETE